MEDSVLARFAQALASGSIRVIDLSQPLTADTAVIQLPPEFGKSWPFHLEEILARMSRQLPLEQKLLVADYVIDTSGTKEATLEQVRKVYSSLRSLTA